MSTYSTPGKVALVCGAGGFIGHHLVKRLKREGFWVRGTDLKFPRFSETEADDFVIGDLRDPHFVRSVIDRRFNEIYQLAADMGGAGYIFTGEHDADVMHNSASINLNVLHAAYTHGRTGGSFTHLQPACTRSIISSILTIRIAPKTRRIRRHPTANMDGKSFSANASILPTRRNHGMEVRIARYHNIFGPEGSWNDGKEKAPAAVCRKVATAPNGGEVEIWGDGKQTRSFLYIDECLEGTLRLTRSDFTGPVNIGSDEMVTIDQLVDTVADIAGKTINKRHIDGPTGVRGRNSDNRLIGEKLELVAFDGSPRRLASHLRVDQLRR